MKTLYGKACQLATHKHTNISYYLTMEIFAGNLEMNTQIP